MNFFFSKRVENIIFIKIKNIQYFVKDKYLAIYLKYFKKSKSGFSIKTIKNFSKFK